MYLLLVSVAKEIPDDCALFNSSPEEASIRQKNIKTGNVISLGLDDQSSWVSCRKGGCLKKECKADFGNVKSNRRKRNTFTTLANTEMEQPCTDHEFILRTTINRVRSDKVKFGDNVTLEWKSGSRFLDCKSMSGACSMTKCTPMDDDGSNGAEECPNHIFRIASDTKKIGDIVQTYDEIQLEYVQNGQLQYVDCTGNRCVVSVYTGCAAPNRVNDDNQPKEDQVVCKPPSFTIQK